MKLRQIAAATLLSTLSHASPLMTFHERQAPGSYYAITGATGGVQPRLEIRQLQQTGEMWNLFLLAMDEFEAMDQKEIDSYYQIAGIHGMPWYDWDGVEMNPGLEQPVRRGYCPHSNVLFGVWHRPYMMLFEQKLQSIAMDIANRFTGAEKSKYQDAANKLRLPYWDWARVIPANEPMVPTAFVTEKVDVTKPDNTKVSIDNPLFDYNFHPKDNAEINGTGCAFPLAGGPLDNHFKMCNEAQTTVRKATDAARNVSNHVTLETQYKNLLGSIRQRTFSVMSKWQPFDSFANNGRCGDPASGSSLEGVHDTIHSEMAPAHMVPLAVSAFDPIFWMHHANVDRFLAIFQAMHPDTWMEGCGADSETWTIKLNDPLTVDSALTPFHMNSEGDFWTPSHARYIEELGYTYPELANNPSNETLIAMLIRDYSGPKDGSPASKVKRQEQNTTSQAYIADTQLPSTGTPYSLYLFLGEVTGEAAEWAGQPSFVGLTSTLGTHLDKPILERVDITEAVEAKIQAGETTAEGAVDYLKANLKWRIVFAGEEIPKDKFPEAKVSLLSTEVEKAKSGTEFDQWMGQLKQHGEVDA